MKRMTRSPIAILGAGAMATALAVILARTKRPIRLYCIEPDVEADICRRSVNKKYLKGVALPKNITAVSELSRAVSDATEIFVAIPSAAMHNVLRKLKPRLAKNVTLVNIAKGLDPNTLKPFFLAASKRLGIPLNRWCTLGGPAVAQDLAHGTPTGLVVAAEDRKRARHVQTLLSSGYVKVIVSQDLEGVGYASALKNPYAIALGLCDGLHFSANAKALILTIALHEMRLLLARVHAREETSLGLAGLGDLVVTGFSPHGRNRTYGEHLARAMTKDPRAMGLQTVEGLAATEIALALARKYGLALPLLKAVGRSLRARRNFAAPFLAYVKQMRFS